MRKVPTIVLSITYKGVKFIDAANKASPLTLSSSACTHLPASLHPEITSV